MDSLAITSAEILWLDLRYVQSVTTPPRTDEADDDYIEVFGKNLNKIFKKLQFQPSLKCQDRLQLCLFSFANKYKVLA